MSIECPSAVINCGPPTFISMRSRLSLRIVSRLSNAASGRHLVVLSMYSCSFYLHHDHAIPLGYDTCHAITFKALCHVSHPVLVQSLGCVRWLGPYSCRRLMTIVGREYEDRIYELIN